MGWSNEARDVALSVLSEFPVGGAVVRLIDKWETDARLGTVEAQVQDLLRAIGNGGRTLDAHIQEAIRIALTIGGGDTLQLRKTQSCLAIMRALNTRSQLGQEWDPSLHRDEAIGIVRSLVAPSDPVAELRAVVFELNRAGLILFIDNANAPEALPWEKIGPDRYFFCRTDAMFQRWNPEEDAKEICRRAKVNRGFNAADLDAALDWGPRRLNSAATYALRRGWISVPYSMAHGGPWVLPWAQLTEEGEFFLD